MSARLTAALVAGVVLASPACHDFQKAYEDCLAAGGQCVPPGGAIRNIGQPCGSLDRCATGTCVDGFCCDTPCTGQCEACDVAGSAGTCTPVSGAPHGGRTACITSDATCAGGCDGTARTACAYPATQCRVASCSGGQEIAPATCSAGACPAMSTIQCAGGICGTTGCATIVDIALGYDYTCAALSDGSAWCWGANSSGQLGVGDDVNRDQPARLTGIDQVTRIFASRTGYHTCAIRSDDSLWCWGNNFDGQLGLGVFGGTHYSPARVNGLNRVESVALGVAHSCAVEAGVGNRRAYCWGNNAFGQLGNGTSGGTAARSNVPVPTCATGTGATCTTPSDQFQVTAGRFHTCTTMLSDNISCWGDNSAGQLGVDPASGSTRVNPVLVTAVNGQADLVYAGEDVTCVISSAKVPQCFGYDGNGQLASGAFDTTTPRYRFTPGAICTVSGCGSTLGLANAFAIGEAHTCALASGGVVRCWGRDGHLQLGDSPADSATPLANVQANLDITGVAFLETGSYHACAANATQMRCWGWNGDSQVGSGSVAADVGTPASPLWP